MTLLNAPAITTSEIDAIAQHSADVVLHNAVARARDEIKQGHALAARNLLGDALRVASDLLAVA